MNSISQVTLNLLHPGHFSYGFDDFVNDQRRFPHHAVGDDIPHGFNLFHCGLDAQIPDGFAGIGLKFFAVWTAVTQNFNDPDLIPS